MSKKEIKLDKYSVKQAKLFFRAIDHPLRQKIIQIIHNRGLDEGICVTDIYVTLRIDQAVASQQLAILRRVNLVIAERRGQHIFYHLNYENLNKSLIYSNAIRELIEN